jgi:hypothetical protein
MSSLTTADLSTVATLVDFVRGPGYVLQFSDREFTQFFVREIGADIDDSRYASSGGSKGKRLRRFLELTDNATAARSLEAIWTARILLLADRAQADPVAAAEERDRTLLGRLGSPFAATMPPPPPPVPVYEKLKAELMALAPLAPHPRGYAFQRFLYGVFARSGARCESTASGRDGASLRQCPGPILALTQREQ